MAEEKKKPEASLGKDAQDNKAIAAIGYLGILFLVPLLAKKDSPFAQYHAKQGLVLFIFEVIVSFIAVIPFLGWIISPLGWLAACVLFVIGMVNAFSGKKQPLPVIGQFSKQLGL